MRPFCWPGGGVPEASGVVDPFDKLPASALFTITLTSDNGQFTVTTIINLTDPAHTDESQRPVHRHEHFHRHEHGKRDRAPTSRRLRRD